MKRSFFVSIIVFCMLFIHAENSYSQNSSRVDITDKLSIEIPNIYTRNESKSCLIDAENKNNGNIILLKTIATRDFNPGKVKQSMDTLCFNLSNAKLIKKEKAKFYRMDEDYVKKYYELGDDKIITYTFYTNKYPYSILFTYNNDSELKTIDDVIESIEIKMNFFGKFYYMFLTSLFLAMIFLLAGVIISFEIMSGKNPIRGIVIFYLIVFALSFIFFPSYSLLYKLIFPLLFFLCCIIIHFLPEEG